MKKGRAGTMIHDYKRNGTTTLFAALNVLEGKVIGRCMQQHRHQEFIRFLNTIEAEVPKGNAVHVVLDNYATHKHPEVRAWLARHKRFTFHFTPTFLLMAQCRGGLLRQALQTALEARRLPIRCRTPDRNQLLHRGDKSDAKALRLDRRSQQNHRRCQTRAPSVRFDPLVDDDALIAASTLALLEDLGHKVVEASSGREALKLLEGGLHPDLIITDHAMPGMTGIEFAVRVRTRKPDIPIVLATGYAELEGAQPIDLPRLAKPFTQDQLSAVIGRLLP